MTFTKTQLLMCLLALPFINNAHAAEIHCDTANNNLSFYEAAIQYKFDLRKPTEKGMQAAMKLKLKELKEIVEAENTNKFEQKKAELTKQAAQAFPNQENQKKCNELNLQLDQFLLK